MNKRLSRELLEIMIRNNTHGGDHKQQELIEIILNNQAIVDNLRTFRRKIVLRKKNYPWDWRELAQELDEVLENTVHSKCFGGKS